MMKKLMMVFAVVVALAVMAALGKQQNDARQSAAQPAAQEVAQLSDWEPRVAGEGERISLRGPVSEEQVRQLVAGRVFAEVFVYDAGHEPGRDKPNMRFIWRAAKLERVY
jgi:hypothetical protein